MPKSEKQIFDVETIQKTTKKIYNLKFFAKWPIGQAGQKAHSFFLSHLYIHINSEPKGNKLTHKKSVLIHIFNNNKNDSEALPKVPKSLGLQRPQ